MSSIIKNRLLRDAVRAVLPIELRRKLADRYFEYQEQRELHKYREELRNPELETTLEDGFLRIYMTYRCNAVSLLRSLHLKAAGSRSEAAL